MAVVTWTGAADGSLSNTANYSGAALPINGDTLRFTGSPANSPSTNLTALASVALASLIVDPGTVVSLGSSSSSMSVAFGSGATVLLSSRTLSGYILIGGSNDPSIIATAGPSGSPFLMACGSSRSIVLSGVPLSGGDFRFTGANTTIAAGARYASGATVAIDSTVTITTGFEVLSGARVTSSANVGNVTVAGTLETSGTATAGTITIRRGGSVVHGSSGTIGSISAIEGGSLAVTTLESVEIAGSSRCDFGGGFVLGLTSRTDMTNGYRAVGDVSIQYPAGTTGTIATPG